MSWNNNEGPWGAPSSKKNESADKKSDGSTSPDKQNADNANPWGRKDYRSGGSSGGSSGGPGNFSTPPDIEAMIEKFQLWLRGLNKDKAPQIAIYAVLGFFTIWMLSGFYQVASNQVGVVMRFGAYARTEQPGLRYHAPYPVEDVLLPVVTAQNEIPVGFRTVYSRTGDESRLVPKPEESMMLTQDENILNTQFTVFWRISDVSKFLFEIRDPETTIKMAAESVMREVIGQNKLQFALTDGRSQIAEEARVRLQSLMDEYNAGIIVTQINLQTVSVPDEVKAAFQDVVNARLDQERMQNQASAHANKVIPEAKGQAAQAIQLALGYKDQKIAIAQGEADRFKEVLTAYSTAREVTAKRLYLETMETILRDAKKVIIDSKVGGGAVPYLPLNQMLGDKKSTEEGRK